MGQLNCDATVFPASFPPPHFGYGCVNLYCSHCAGNLYYGIVGGTCFSPSLGTYIIHPRDMMFALELSEEKMKLDFYGQKLEQSR